MSLCNTYTYTVVGPLSTRSHCKGAADGLLHVGRGQRWTDGGGGGPAGMVRGFFVKTTSGSGSNMSGSAGLADGGLLHRDGRVGAASGRSIVGLVGGKGGGVGTLPIFGPVPWGKFVYFEVFYVTVSSKIGKPTRS